MALVYQPTNPGGQNFNPDPNMGANNNPDIYAGATNAPAMNSLAGRAPSAFGAGRYQPPAGSLAINNQAQPPNYASNQIGPLANNNISDYYRSIYANSPGVQAANPANQQQNANAFNPNAPIYSYGPNGPVQVSTALNNLVAGITPQQSQIPSNWMVPQNNGTVAPIPQDQLTKLNASNTAAYANAPTGIKPVGLAGGNWTQPADYIKNLAVQNIPGSNIPDNGQKALGAQGAQGNQNPYSIATDPLGYTFWQLTNGQMPPNLTSQLLGLYGSGINSLGGGGANMSAMLPLLLMFAGMNRNSAPSYANNVLAQQNYAPAQYGLAL